MKPESVTRLLEVLHALTLEAHTHWLKITALELTLNAFPEMRKEYDHQLSQLSGSLAAERVADGTMNRLAKLKENLLKE